MTDREGMAQWLTGWPDKRGVYFCRVDDGPEVALHHHNCGDTKRHWWTDTSGYDVIGHVEYRLPAIVCQNK